VANNFDVDKQAGLTAEQAQRLLCSNCGHVVEPERRSTGICQNCADGGRKETR